jgi:RimJ/RimL family protein N-acetyltransferase
LTIPTLVIFDLLDIMSFTNSFKGDNTPFPSGYYGPDPYDINWMMPLHEATLESDRVKLTPFIPSLHARAYADELKTDPDLHRWFPFDLSTLDDILAKTEILIRQPPLCLLFAIIDKARGDALAGVISLVNVNPANLRAEIAWLVVFPEFRRSYVTSNAIGLLLNYCLELPDPPSGRRPGLGFRRVEWAGHTENQSSITVAERMGFKEECLSRWVWVLPEGAEGNGIPIRDGDPMSTRPGRHSVLFSFCADDWESGGREHVQQMIHRQ